ncbi:TPA: hypothetical protein I7144_20705 [Vibrio vulnificus]|nr:hypothetical protein [Vibrio vulnificus]
MNHIAGNWFISIFTLYKTASNELRNIVNNKNYRETTRRNAQLILDQRNNLY